MTAAVMALTVLLLASYAVRRWRVRVYFTTDPRLRGESRARPPPL